MPCGLLILILCLTCGSSIVLAELNENETNVCKRTVEISNYNLHSDCANLSIELYLKCLSDSNKIHSKNEFYCCDGYREEAGKCEPVCSRCYNGECAEPNRCDCLPGFGGESCNQGCDFGKFGHECEHDCKCILDKECNQDLTYCSCLGDISEDCRQICKCKLRLCPPGTMGDVCEMSCPTGKFGYGCIRTCLCEEKNTLECGKTNGVCKCKKNFYGEKCENKCEGVLTCLESSNGCTCEPTIEQKIEQRTKETKDHIERKANETKKHFEQKTNETREHFERQFNETKFHLEHLERKTNETKEHFEERLREAKNDLAQKAKEIGDNLEQNLNEFLNVADNIRDEVDKHKNELNANLLKSRNSFFSEILMQRILHDIDSDNVKEHLEKEIKGMNKKANYLIIITVVMSIIFLIVFVSLLVLKKKIKNLKKNTKIISVKYSKEKKTNEFDNPIYEESLSTKSTEKSKASNSSNRLYLFQKLNFIPDKLLRRKATKTSVDKAKLTQESTASEIYSSLNEIELDKNEETIKMPDNE